MISDALKNWLLSEQVHRPKIKYVRPRITVPIIYLIQNQALEYYPQCDGSNVRKKTCVLLVSIVVSIHEAQVSNAILKAVGIEIPSFNEPPTWK